MKDIINLTNIFQEVAVAIEKRQTEAKKRQGKLFAKGRQLRHDIWHKGDDENQVKQLRSKVENGIQSFHIVAHVRNLDALRKIESEMKEAANQQAERLEQIQHIQTLEFIERKLSPVWKARFDGNGTPEGCLPHTRERLLDQLGEWITDTSPSSPRIFLLSGLAGTGKTTVAQSICIRYDKETGVVSFFVSRDSAERRDPEKIIQTIAYQLGSQQIAARTAINNALQNGRDITTRPLAEQL